jgi:TatD DNase family protein
MWIDAHAHLYDFSDSHLAELLDTARNNAVDTIINTAVSLETSSIILRQCEKHKGMFGAVGISPSECALLPAEWETMLRNTVSHPSVIAVGECGIDSVNSRYPPLTRQRQVFIRQLRLARELNRPVVIHSRGAELEAVELCVKNNVSRALFHCFTGSGEAARAVIDAGYYISLSGIVTFKNSPLRTLVDRIPLERLCIETDTPYLAPVPYRGSPNQPAWVAITGKTLAQLYDLSQKAFSEHIRRTVSALFDIEL